MVMRNRHSGAEPSGWWDDLPPQVRERFGVRPVATPPAPTRPLPGPHNQQLLDARPPLALLREMTLLSLLLLGIAVANILFLLLALSYLNPGPNSSTSW